MKKKNVSADTKHATKLHMCHMSTKLVFPTSTCWTVHVVVHIISNMTRNSFQNCYVCEWKYINCKKKKIKLLILRSSVFNNVF